MFVCQSAKPSPLAASLADTVAADTDGDSLPLCRDDDDDDDDDDDARVLAFYCVITPRAGPSRRRFARKPEEANDAGGCDRGRLDFVVHPGPSVRARGRDSSLRGQGGILEVRLRVCVERLSIARERERVE